MVSAHFRYWLLQHYFLYCVRFVTYAHFQNFSTNYPSSPGKWKADFHIWSDWTPIFPYTLIFHCLYTSHLQQEQKHNRFWMYVHHKVSYRLKVLCFSSCISILFCLYPHFVSASYVATEMQKLGEDCFNLCFHGLIDSQLLSKRISYELC